MYCMVIIVCVVTTYFFGQRCSIVRFVLNLIVEHGEIESKTKSDRVSRL